MSDKIHKTSQSTNDQLTYPSLTIIAELTKERVADQLEQVKTIDNKANFVLGAATALVSAALILQTGLLTTQSTSPPQNPPISYIFSNTSLFHLLPLALLILPYLVVMICAFLAYRIRVYKQAPDPVTLYEKYLQQDEEMTKSAVYRATLEAYKTNVKTIQKKVRYLNIAFAFLALETIMLALTLILQVIL